MVARQEDAASTLRDVLLADHRRIDDVLTRILVALEAVDPDRVATEWAEFHRALSTHLDAEDRYLIPALFACRPRDARSLLQEHRHIRSRAVDLDNHIGKGTLNADTLRGFADELSAHVRRETAVLYEWADDELEESDRDAVLRAVTPTARPLFNAKVRTSGKGDV
ncbi:MAG: hemerythrin domain-containing protein [Polyangiaceae bacterium]|jgi:hemerythrin-like domain-containing protein